MQLKQRKLSLKKQSGTVLILGLTLILILSVIVISSARTTVLQQKMSANLRDKELAFQAAESALKIGESYLRDTQREDLAGNFSGSEGLFLFDNNLDLADDSAWANLDTLEARSFHQVAK
ncbi:MAG: pilus assembly PilX family protein, partial [Leucothrix sp.]